MPDPRLVPEPTSIGYTDATGKQVELSSKTLKGDDTYHFIEPRNAAEVAHLDSLGLPVARKALQEVGRATASRRRATRKTADAPAVITETSAADPQPSEPAETDGGSD